MKGYEMTPELKRHNLPAKELEDFLILDNDGKSTERIKPTNTKKIILVSKIYFDTLYPL